MLDQLRMNEFDFISRKEKLLFKELLSYFDLVLEVSDNLDKAWHALPLVLFNQDFHHIDEGNDFLNRLVNEFL